MCESLLPRLCVVRHGETELNLRGVAIGHLDAPLTVLGRAQAARAGVRLRDLFASAGERPLIVTSTLGRARETGRIIAASIGASVERTHADARLNGVNAGSWDGRSLEEVAREHPFVRELGGPLDWFFAAPDGESYELVRSRVSAWLDEANGSGAPIIAVTHGITGRLLRGERRGLCRGASLALGFPRESLFVLDGVHERELSCVVESE